MLEHWKCNDSSASVQENRKIGDEISSYTKISAESSFTYTPWDTSLYNLGLGLLR
jgi:hypothetical protein